MDKERLDRVCDLLVELEGQLDQEVVVAIGRQYYEIERVRLEGEKVVIECGEGT